MKNLVKLFLVYSLIFSTKSVAQCPVASFSLPDTSCGGLIIPIQNNSSGSNLKYEWDFNANDMALAPQSSSIGVYSGSVSSSLGIDIFQSAGNYFGFTMSLWGGLTRLNFGTSLNNPPIVTALGNIGGLSSPVDVSIIEENGLYYALVNTLGGGIYRLEFGTSLGNTPTAVQINVSSTLFNNAYYHTVHRTNSGLFMLISNYSGGTVTVVNFGNTILNNNPTTGNIAVPIGNPISIAVGQDCNGYYGFVGYASNATISRIEFGPAISSSPIQIVNLSTIGQTGYREINLLNDGYNWVLAAASFDGSILQRFSFGPSLNNLTPTVDTYAGLSAFKSGCYAFCLKKTNSLIKGFVTNYNTGEITSFTFPESNSGAPSPSQTALPAAIFNGNGYYHMNLTVTDTITGKFSRARDSIFIASQPVSNFTFTNACKGLLTVFTSTSSTAEGTITDFNWSSGNGDTSNTPDPSFQYPNSGLYNVTLEVSNNFGCSNSLTQQIEVFDNPDTDFNFIDNQCMGVEVQLTDLTTVNSGSIAKWNWDFGNGETSSIQNPTNSWENDGTSTITLITETNNGCRDTSTAIISIIPGPIVEFEVIRTCLSDTAQFINITNIPSSVTAQYLWTFGDGSTSNEDNPGHSFPSVNAADFEVQLIATGSNGCNDSITRTIHIGQSANADFTLSNDSICVLSPLVLNNVSLIPFGEIEKSTTWDFGNGNGDSSNASSIATYQNPGIYQIRLTIETNTSCKTSIQKNVVVIENPEADFTAGNACIGTPILFIENSRTPAGTTLTAWQWDFGDSTNSSIQSPSHQYQSAGIFPVILTVTHNLGCTDSTFLAVVNYEQPSAYFVYSKACSNVPTVFTDSSLVTDGSITQWDWNFGDGSLNNTTSNPSHVFAQSAAFPVSLIVTSNHGCRDSISRLIPVDPSPSFILNSYNVCHGSITEYSVNFLSPPPINTGHLWDFGDSTSSTQPLPTHLYSQPGTYNTNLTISDLDNGCSITQITNPVVYRNPVAGFSCQNVCSDSPFITTDTSSSNGTTITDWKWDAGNYGIFSTQNIQFTTFSADTFPLKLVVTTDNGCKDSTTKNLISFPMPISSFIPDPTFGSPPLTANFINNSTSGTYSWDFGDGNTITGTVNPTHIYNDTGVYNTTLTVTTANGCIGSSNFQIHVIEPFTDLGIMKASYYLDNNNWLMELQIQNAGNTVVRSAEFRINLQYQPAISEFIANLNLSPGDMKWITLGTRFPADITKNPDRFCAEITLVNEQQDDNFANNRNCKSLSSDFTLYPIHPNPGPGIFQLPVNSDKEREIIFTLYSGSGQILSSPYRLMAKEGFRTYEFNLTDYPDGMYLITIQSEYIMETFRLIKN